MLPRELFAGTIAALVNIAYAVSFSALIFSGPLESGLSYGFSALLTGSAVTGLVIGLFTRLIPADAGPDTPAVAVMSALAISIAASLPAGMSGPDMAFHVLVAITIATLLTGLLLFALGAFRCGVWLRFIPYPVIGGFLAASGWLLFTGGLGVALNTSNLWAALSTIGTNGLLPQLAVAAGLALAIVAARRFFGGFALLPLAFLAGVVVVDFGIFLSGYLSAEPAGAGWFLDSVRGRALWMPLMAIPGADIHWAVLLGQGVEVAAVCGVTAVALLLDVSSLEVARGKATDLDHELRVNGLANMAAAPLGGVAGNLSMVGSLLIAEAGGLTRMATIFAALVCALAIYAGQWVLSIVPTPVLGGVLAYLGLNILYKSLISSAAQRSLSDNILAVGIALAIAVFGYLIGIVLGILGACLSFAFSYSRISIIRQHLTRANFRSNLDRSPEQMRLLARHGGAIQILWLRGFIFFGTSNTLFEYVRRLVSEARAGAISHIVLDFAHVPGFDSSAVFSLVKLKNICADHDVTLVLSGLSERMGGFLKGADFFAANPSDSGSVAPPVRTFDHRDEALQWCEDELLAAHGAVGESDEHFRDWIAGQLGGGIDAEDILGRLKRMTVKSGAYAVRQGKASNSIDFIASGRVVIAYEDDQGRMTRLRHLAAQTVVGEMGFYRKAKRAASVIAEQPTVLYRMERKAYDQLASDVPEAAAAFNGFVIRLLSDRLEFANREISALQEPAPE